jgi:hypothetical protein
MRASTELRIGLRQAAGAGRAAPDRAGEREDRHPVRAIREPADRKRDEAIEQRRIEPADQAELPIGDMQRVLDRLRQDRDQLAVEEVEDINEG